MAAAPLVDKIKLLTALSFSWDSNSPCSGCHTDISQTQRRYFSSAQPTQFYINASAREKEKESAGLLLLLKMPLLKTITNSSVLLFNIQSRKIKLYLVSVKIAEGPQASGHKPTQYVFASVLCRQKGQTSVLVNKKGLIQLPTQRHLMSFRVCHGAWYRHPRLSQHLEKACNQQLGSLYSVSSTTSWCLGSQTDF